LYLTIFQLLQVPEDHRFAQFRRKLSEPHLNLAAQFPQERQLIGATRRRLLVFNHGHRVIERVGDAISSGSTVMVDQQIARHAGHPCNKSAVGRTVAGQRAVYPEENLLRQILGFRAITREPVANVKDTPRVAAHKFLPGRAVALEALLDQLGILLQRLISLGSCYRARG